METSARFTKPAATLRSHRWPDGYPGVLVMKSTNWKDIAELVGSATIVASLIFVGLQMKQSHDIALAAQYQARAQATMDLYTAAIEAGYDWSSAAKPEAEQTPVEIAAAESVRRWGWTAFENHHFQYQAGYLTQESWDGLRNRIRDLYANPAGRATFEGRKRYMRQSFVDYVEQIGGDAVGTN